MNLSNLTEDERVLVANAAIIRAICQGDSKRVEDLFQQGADNYNQCLLIAIQHSYVKIAKLIVDRYENEITAWHTHFMAVCEVGMIEIFDACLLHVALDTYDSREYGTIAIKNGHIKIIEKLIQNRYALSGDNYATMAKYNNEHMLFSLLDRGMLHVEEVWGTLCFHARSNEEWPYEYEYQKIQSTETLKHYYAIMVLLCKKYPHLLTFNDKSWVKNISKVSTYELLQRGCHVKNDFAKTMNNKRNKRQTEVIKICVEQDDNPLSDRENIAKIIAEYVEFPHPYSWSINEIHYDSISYYTFTQ